MPTKIIEFSCDSSYLLQNEDLPSPIKLNIPEWFKKLEHTHDNKTVKGCIPFLETLTTGYMLKIPQDFTIRHNFLNEQSGEMDTFYKFALAHKDSSSLKNINLNSAENTLHNKVQLEGSPYVEKNKNLNFYKILNPWIIKTPLGYSTLFLPPLNNSDDRFNIIPGIVDTDSFNVHINFPIVINGDKYPSLETTIKKGTPYVQVIPFKRDDWKMKIKEIEKKRWFSGDLLNDLRLLHNYKLKYWFKKSWN